VTAWLSNVKRRSHFQGSRIQAGAVNVKCQCASQGLRLREIAADFSDSRSNIRITRLIFYRESKLPSWKSAANWHKMHARNTRESSISCITRFVAQAAGNPIRFTSRPFMIEITKRDGPSTYQSDAMIAVQSANRIRDRRDDKINRARYPHTYPSPPPFWHASFRLLERFLPSLFILSLTYRNALYGQQHAPRASENKGTRWSDRRPA